MAQHDGEVLAWLATPDPTGSRASGRWVGGLNFAMEHPTQHEEDDRGADEDQRRRATAVAEVALHEHEPGGLARIGHGSGRGFTRLGVLLDDRLHLHEGVVRPMEEGEQVEAADHRETLAALVEHGDGEVLARLEHLGLVLENVVGGSDGLAPFGSVVGQLASRWLCAQSTEEGVAVDDLLSSAAGALMTATGFQDGSLPFNPMP